MWNIWILAELFFGLVNIYKCKFVNRNFDEHFMCDLLIMVHLIGRLCISS